VAHYHPEDIDVRIVAATNRDPRAEVAAGRFRQDLFYRLNVFAVRIPALRDRLADLPALTRHFLEGARGEAWTIEPAVFEALTRHDWPGNIRELGNLCSALAVRARATHRIGLEDLEHAWRRQYQGDPPWSAGAAAPRGRLGDWALAEARRSRFNLVDAARRLAREKRAGRSVPITERSALSYYVTGEILRAIVASGGDAGAATRAIAGEPDLEPRVSPRVARVLEALKASGSLASARRRFGKLPAEYGKSLERALEAL
jgi:DNA-binding NtrC family response regulator